MPKFFIFLSILLLSQNSHGFDNICYIDKYNIFPLLYDGDSIVKRECKVTASIDFMSVMRIINTYWDRGATNLDRYKLLTKSYKAILSKFHNIKNAESYIVPLEEYERFWLGYNVQDVTIVSSVRMEVKLRVRWAQEGYNGDITYIFSMLNEGGVWKIDAIMV
jgi:hypothetical protein